MNTRRTPARRVEENDVNEESPHQVEQVLQGAQGFALTIHVNKGIDPRVNVVEITMTSRLRDFVRMNPPIIHHYSFPREPPRCIACRGNESKEVPPSVPGGDAPWKNHFYALQIRGSKLDDDDDGVLLELNFIESLHCAFHKDTIMF
ncbi:hypothetical protein EJD97_021477 [Solanum chilense]|uniref:Uncharacterized protein n=1 Tax=Solanum chilense TaxID=4083 RepID=A0A6N2CA44_SOLCI|nr:hypothetical protein EJD97_021477 [Solanum chilense]